MRPRLLVPDQSPVYLINIVIIIIIILTVIVNNNTDI